MVESIHFGTDGWRGVIAREFTFGNVARVGQAIARYLRSEERAQLDIYRRWRDVAPGAPEQGVVIGYDMRFMAGAFAEHIARVLMQNDVPVVLSQGPVPTPAVSYAVPHRKAALGLMITASHNPPEYCGIKLKTEPGGAAGPEITELVERFLPGTPPDVDPALAPKRVDLSTPYLERVRELIDVELLTGAPLRVVVDAMYGSGRGCIGSVLDDLGIPHVDIRHGINPLFGGTPPEPIEAHVAPLKAVVGAERVRRSDGRILMGIVTDGDGDRVAAVDELGHFVDPHRCYALLFRHLLEKGLRGKAVKSFTLSDMATRIAERHGVTLDEVPVGFKHVSEKLLTNGVLIGGEESGGIAVKGHIPERDGVLIGLLLLEAVARQGKAVSRIVEEMMDQIGHHFYRRRDLHLEERVEVVQRLKELEPHAFAGRAVRAIETLDGIKFRFDDGWLLFRASGTEPVLRVYCEMDDPVKVDEIIEEAVKVARGEQELWG